MKTNSAWKYCLLVSLFLLALTVCDSRPATRILFIGNSYTSFNGGLDKHLKGLASSAETESIVVGGFSLEKHYAEASTLKKIREGKWNYVVLQEQSQLPVIAQTKFYDAVRQFDGEIQRSGAKTVLLMTWERPDSVSFGVTTKGLSDAYSAIGAEIGAIVVPAGLAFARSISKRSDLVLYSQDGHPTNLGTYLAACVLYRSIFGLSPVGNRYVGGVTSPGWREYLQQIASDRS